MKKISSIFIIAILLSSCSNKFKSYKQVERASADRAGLNYSDSSIVLAPGLHYKRGVIHKFFWGSHYRTIWATPVEVGVLDLSRENGGLKPTRKGGSSQTFTLRLNSATGHEYVLRSVDKDPSKVLPENMRKGMFARIMRDQTSTSFPYASYIASALAHHAGVYHTNPKMVYVPHDSALGEFYGDFAGMLALLEERGEGDWSSNNSFGNSKKLVSSKKMFKNLVEDNDDKVDQQALLKARMLDMIVGDWSRREDQWRWASFKTENGTTYKPVPRDRDHAMFQMKDGVIPWLATRFFPEFKSFTPRIRDVKNFNKAGSRLDNVFLNELDKDTWMKINDSIVASLTDANMATAVKVLPDTINKIIGDKIYKRLVSRRESLRKANENYYKMLSRKVTINGTDKHELFEIIRPSNDTTIINVYKINKEGEQKNKIYSRTFLKNETKAIYLVGLDGKDRFKLSGNASKGIKVYMTGGAGNDSFIDESTAEKSGRRTYAFDTKNGNDIKLKETKVTLTDRPLVQNFNGEGWLLRFRLD